MSMPRDTVADAPLTSRAVIGFTGLAYWFVGLGFSYLDRRYGSLGLEWTLWTLWAAAGFIAGVVHVGAGPQVGQTQWRWLGALGGLLALFPGFLVFNLLRWTALTLMVIMGARAAVLKTRRDLYFTLTVVFVVSFMVGTHGMADWTLWFYLGPAWLFGALALAWDHASGVALSRWTKALMSLSFVVLSFVVAFLVFFLAPRPPTLGFGFLPPGTDTPGMFQTPGGGGDADGAVGAGGATAVGTDAGGNGVGSRAGGSGAAPSRWGAMLGSMRQAAADPKIPAWQRSLMERMLDAVQALVDALKGKDTPEGRPLSFLMVPNPWVLLLLLMALLMLAYGLWAQRYRRGVDVLLGGAWLLETRYPGLSMRLSAMAMGWWLRGLGHRRQPGQSVREHWGQAPGLASLPQRWMLYALESYCAARFSSRAADTMQAVHLRRAVHAVSDITRGHVPELNR